MNFNSCRASALDAFRATLIDIRQMPNLMEIQFRNAWLARLQKDKMIYASGWYDPPPHGLSVLFAPSENPSRISFESLRQEAFWPGNTSFDPNGFLFAYSSCVSRKTGVMGDFGVTLYFGNDSKLKDHYRNCFSATDCLLRNLKPSNTSKTIFKQAEEIFSDAGLKNSVVSVTDITTLDLGHTYPVLSQNCLSRFPNELSVEHKYTLRTSRKFINDLSDWPLEEDVQFTIEPQLRSIDDPSLPQISFHYLAKIKNGEIEICRDIDALIKPCLV